MLRCSPRPFQQPDACCGWSWGHHYWKLSSSCQYAQLQPEWVCEHEDGSSPQPEILGWLVHIGALALAEALKVNKTLTDLTLENNCIGQVGIQALGEARKVNGILTKLDIQGQINPLAFSLLPRLATTEDWQSVFHLLTGRHELENQPALLPALPAEVAELVMHEAEYLQGVQHIHQAWSRNNQIDFLKLTMPRSSNGNSIRVKAIQVLREQSEAKSGRFDLIVRDELGAVRYKWAAEAPVVGSNIQLVTISPTDHPVIRQMREGWEVEVRFGQYYSFVRLASLSVGYIERQD
ncbi:hypothetical protein CAOG_09139 [Capsaspora owczarzaki ATCC 30864]|uniref:hypothetical protein n=1 Tax=Capsaspora owczarzaki (strain ATCC 30864) TaxID=595528 RepID=UPI0003523D5F|nr:hypothetical protein CAOG_09139 [Capsaspora owczarzaki ATCC 30864]|eukprot:XP_011270849.1 hypothetical protein CAOG_09139 [Capsaspora owczarzaki ATCC 30864]